MAPIQSENDSPFYIERVSQYVPLPPASLTSALPSICANVFSPLLLTYFPPVHGVVLGYENVKLSDEEPRSTTKPSKGKKRHHQAASDPAADASEQDTSNGETVLLRQIDEYTSPFVWATASLLVWRPAEGSWITATLTHQSSTHITLSHLNTFPISILPNHLPKEWSWHTEEANKKKKGWDGRIADEGGWWVDGEGQRVGQHGELRVRIREWDARGGMGKGRGSMKIEGSLLTMEEEVRQREKGKERANGAVNGVLSGEVMEVD